MLAVAIGLVLAQAAGPLRLHVYATPRGEPELIEAIERAAAEIRAAAGGDDLFEYVEDRERAEIVLYVEALAITDETKREGSTTSMGGNTHTTEFMSPAEDFRLQSVTEVLGRTVVLAGRSRTSETRAASALLAELRDHVTSNDTIHERRRMLFRYWAEHPEQIATARALCESVELRSKEEELGVLSAHWSGSTLVVRTRRRTSRFPFTSSRLETCMPDPACRQELEEQVIATIARQ